MIWTLKDYEFWVKYQPFWDNNRTHTCEDCVRLHNIYDSRPMCPTKGCHLYHGITRELLEECELFD
jgi:hypothetical protein